MNRQAGGCAQWLPCLPPLPFSQGSRSSSGKGSTRRPQSCPQTPSAPGTGSCMATGWGGGTLAESAWCERRQRQQQREHGRWVSGCIRDQKASGPSSAAAMCAGERATLRTRRNPPTRPPCLNSHANLARAAHGRSEAVCATDDSRTKGAHSLWAAAVPAASCHRPQVCHWPTWAATAAALRDYHGSVAR